MWVIGKKIKKIRTVKGGKILDLEGKKKGAKERIASEHQCHLADDLREGGWGFGKKTPSKTDGRSQGEI